MNHRFPSMLVVGALSAAACVGDNPAESDSGTDAALDQASSDVLAADVTDASDAATCGECDGSCYHGLCNGNAVVDLSMGTTHACALLKDGSVWCWGDNQGGEIQSPPTSSPIAVPTQIAGVANVIAISAGDADTCVVESDSTVWCWGVNRNAELGHAVNTAGDIVCGTHSCNPMPTKVSGIAAKQVQAGRFTACGLTTTGTVACWGSAAKGLMGTVADADIPSATAIAGLTSITQLSQAAIQGANACAIDSAANVWCWGENSLGAAGHTPGALGDVVCANGVGSCNGTPHKVTLAEDGGGGAFTNVSSVTSAGAVCAAQAGGSVWCWGWGPAGQLGDGINTVYAPTMVTSVSGAGSMSGDLTVCTLKATGDVVCWGGANTEIPGSYGVDAGCNYAGPITCALTPTKVAGVSATRLSVGYNAAAALTTDGKLVAWGGNAYGQLGHPIGTNGDDSNNNNPTPIAVQGLP